MWKLVIYQTKEVDGQFVLGRCSVFQFNTKAAADKAQEFFKRGDCWTEVILDGK